MKKTFLIIAASVGLLFSCVERTNQQHAGPRGNGPQEVVRIDTVVKVVNEAFVGQSEGYSSQAAGFANTKLDKYEQSVLSSIIGNTFDIPYTSNYHYGSAADQISPLNMAISAGNSAKLDTVINNQRKIIALMSEIKKQLRKKE
jgi:hypothetical protein